jgi:pilus assembly protein CpaE
MADHTILVVDDSCLVNDVVRDVLQAAGFSVVQALSGGEALNLLAAQAFDLILIDVDMPQMDGYELTERIRSLPASAEVAVLMLRTKELKGKEPPSTISSEDYVIKPIDPVDLIARVKSRLTEGAGDGVRAADHHGSPRQPVQAASADLGNQVDERPPAIVRSTLGATSATALMESPALDPAATPVPLSRSVTGGKIITVFSLKGGVGTTSIATNLAISLQQLWAEPTALIDLSLESGSLNILLDMLPTSTLDDLARQNGHLTAEIAAQYLGRHKSGVSLLAAPQSPERAELIQASTVRNVLGLLREAFDYVVIDTASNFSEHSLVALETADVIILPLIADISSVRAANTALDIFRALSIQDDRVIPILNEIVPKIGLSRKHVEAGLHRFVTPLPSGGGKMMDSINRGTPLVMAEPDLPVAKAIEDLAFAVSRPESKAKQRPKPSELLIKVRKRVKG